MEVSHEATRLQHVWRRACCTAATGISVPTDIRVEDCGEV